MQNTALLPPHGPLRLHRNEPTARSGSAAGSYPDYAPLLATLAAGHQISRDNLLLTPGSDAALDVVCRGSAGHVVLLDPDFVRYADHAANAGRRIIKVSTPPDGSQFPTDALLEAIDETTGLVIVSTIGNPTTYQLPRELPALILERAPHVLIAVDEVYEAFADVQCTALAASTPGIVSIHSLSKIGFPGLRVGYTVGHPATLERLRPFASPAVSSLSAKAAVDVLTQPAIWRSEVARQQAARRFAADQLRARGISMVREGGNWVLARFGSGARRLADELARRGIHVSAPDSPVLAEWLRISTPDRPAIETFLDALDAILEAPTAFVDGQIVMGEEFRHPGRWMDASFALRVGNEVHAVDHYAITVADGAAHLDFVAGLVGCGATLVEGPGVWPTEFCAEMRDLPPDRAMHFATIELRPGALLVVAAPCEPGDQLHRFRAARGPHAVHHVALAVTDISAAARGWLSNGWRPLSPSAITDGDLAQWFLMNADGQIVELIERSGDGHATFTCANIKALRLAERS